MRRSALVDGREECCSSLSAVLALLLCRSSSTNTAHDLDVPPVGGSMVCVCPTSSRRTARSLSESSRRSTHQTSTAGNSRDVYAHEYAAKVSLLTSLFSSPREAKQLLALPADVGACVFNVDGVLVPSAVIHTQPPIRPHDRDRPGWTPDTRDCSLGSRRQPVRPVGLHVRPGTDAAPLPARIPSQRRATHQHPPRILRLAVTHGTRWFDSSTTSACGSLWVGHNVGYAQANPVHSHAVGGRPVGFALITRS